jgi:hypothetical protein
VREDIGKRMECDGRTLKRSRTRILMHLVPIEQIVLISFFGKTEIALEGNIEALGPK